MRSHIFRASASALSSLLAAAALSSCASTSSDTRFGSEVDVSDVSQASGHAYGADAMILRTPQKVRPPNDFKFYFRECVLNGESTFYSKTSYWCEEI